MPLATIRELFTHNDWARDELLGLASRLPDAGLDRSVPMGPGSLRKTLHHLWAAEKLWLDRWEGRLALSVAEPEPALATGELWRRFRNTAQQRNKFLDALRDEEFSAPLTFKHGQNKSYTFPLLDLALHVCNHGFHHRAQALNMLRHAGAKVGNLDYLIMRIEYPTVEYDPEMIVYWNDRGLMVSDSVVEPARVNLDVLRHYLRYGDRAGALLYDGARSLTDDQLDRVFPLGHETLRRTLLHIRDAEQWWYENWTLSPPPKALPSFKDSTSLAKLEDLSEETAARRDAFLEGLCCDDLQRTVLAYPVTDACIRCRLGESVLQLCGHGTHHRAQAFNMLRQLGVTLPSLDFV